MIGFVSPTSGRALVREGDYLTAGDERFPVVDGIPRFVSADNYAASFGLEWKSHARTQLDSHLGKNYSQVRLTRCLGRSLNELEGKTVLEAGCGAGRFTELLVKAGALVHAIDLSVAVEANRDNIGSADNYCVAQASILAPPFPAESFDYVLCIGVLQHLPSPEEGMRSLWRLVKPGGWLVIDHYAWSLSYVTKLAWLYRLPLRRMPPERAKTITDSLTRFFFPLHWAVRGLPPAQMLLSRVSPSLVYFRALPELDKQQHLELSKLDTFDSLTDYYKHFRTSKQIRRALAALGAEDIQVTPGGNGIEARAHKPVR